MQTATQPIPAAPVYHQPIGQGPAQVAMARSVPTVAAGRRPWGAIFGVLAVFIALIGTFIIFLMTSSKTAQIAQLQRAIEDLESEIASPPLSETNQVIGSIQTTLQGYKAATAKKTNFIAMSEELPRIVPRDMRMSSLSIDEKGTFHPTAKSKEFETPGKALLAFRQSKVLSNVQLGNVGMIQKEGESGVNFDITGGAIIKRTTTPTATPSPVAGEEN